MFRILFQWRGTKIYSYTAMLYLGLVLGVVAGTYFAEFRGLDPKRVYFAIILLTVPALLGARLLFVATHWNQFKGNPRRILRRSDGGAMLYGGLLLSLGTSVPLLHVLNIPFAGFWDAATMTILVAMVPARIGCLLNGCCSGRATDGRFGFVTPNENGIARRRVPSQLMEIALALLLLATSLGVVRSFPLDGVFFLSAAAGYGIGRLWLESLRETTVRIGPLNLQRAISGVLATCSTVSLLLIWLHQ